MQRKHCICGDCGPVLYGNNNNNTSENTSTIVDRSNTHGGCPKRIFLVVHHKEIGLKIDTAKLILAAFPSLCELVVGGIGPEHQPSMKKLLDSIEDPKRTSLLLFPDDAARTLGEIVNEKRISSSKNSKTRTPPENDDDTDGTDNGYDLIVLDGTWAQARKFHSRYFPEEPSPSLQRVRLSEASVELLHGGSTETGHQLRRHEIPWRQVGTFEAFRLFLRDWAREFPSVETKDSENENRVLEFWEQIEGYQRISNDAALKELGPPRS
mmetsp:Transcript_3156/g.7063  ORF Transcript_3156/g.7063 Transcript_3156/m.7063 type:complete len:267 (+) Transcript_3156:352-1152(+)